MGALTDARRITGTALGRPGGADALPGHLRSVYAAVASLDARQGHRPGCERLRSAIRDAGIVVRAPGRNTDDGRRSRALSADAAARVGTDDLPDLDQHRRRVADLPVHLAIVMASGALSPVEAEPWLRSCG